MSSRPKLGQSSAKLKSPRGPVKSVGKFITMTVWNKKRTSFWIFVVAGNTNCLISRSAALSLGLVKRLDEMNDLAFGAVGKPVDCDPVKIVLKEDAEPDNIPVARRIPTLLLPKVEQELQHMLSDGVIKEITEPTDWCSPIVPVLKENGDVRICVDLKCLNKVIKKERYTLPAVDDITHKLAGAKVFSKLDATSVFWQIPLDENTAKLTTFLTPVGRFYFKRLPFGISLAPEIFQRTMESILNGLDGVMCYMDDTVVCGDTTEEHDKRLTKVLK